MDWKPNVVTAEAYLVQEAPAGLGVTNEIRYCRFVTQPLHVALDRLAMVLAKVITVELKASGETLAVLERQEICRFRVDSRLETLARRACQSSTLQTGRASRSYALICRY